MSRRQLIAIDGSEQAQHAFDWYLENFYRQGDTVVLAHVAELNINVGLPGAQDLKAINEICEQVKAKNEEIDKMTGGFMNTLRQKQIESKLLTLNGKPGEALTVAAHDEKVDHIIMGTRGLGKIRRTFLGSVSEYVIHHSDCPVTIVRNSSSTE